MNTSLRICVPPSLLMISQHTKILTINEIKRLTMLKKTTFHVLDYDPFRIEFYKNRIREF